MSPVKGHSQRRPVTWTRCETDLSSRKAEDRSVHAVSITSSNVMHTGFSPAATRPRAPCPAYRPPAFPALRRRRHWCCHAGPGLRWHSPPPSAHRQSGRRPGCRPRPGRQRWQNRDGGRVLECGADFLVRANTRRHHWRSGAGSAGRDRAEQGEIGLRVRLRGDHDIGQCPRAHRRSSRNDGFTRQYMAAAPHSARLDPGCVAMHERRPIPSANRGVGDLHTHLARRMRHAKECRVRRVSRWPW